MNAAIGKLLTHFDANGRTKPAERPKLPDAAAARPNEVRREPPPPASKAEAPPINLLDDAYRRGYAAGLGDSDVKLAEERVRSAVRLGEERAKWSDQQAAVMVNGFAAACRELETSVARSVAHILQPFLVDAVRDKAVAALVEQIAALTFNSPVPVFQITGPVDLLDLVKAQLDATGRTGIEYQVAEAAEVRVIADQTVIETQISAWTGRLKDACW